MESCQSSTSVFRVSGQPMQLRPGLPHPASCLTRPPLFQPLHPSTGERQTLPVRSLGWAATRHILTRGGGPWQAAALALFSFSPLSASTCISHPIPGFDVGGLILGAKSTNRLLSPQPTWTRDWQGV